MAKTWQRRLCELPVAKDLTELVLGDDYVWDVRKVVVCPSCGRTGVTIKGENVDGVAHVVAADQTLLDYCLRAEFVDGAPPMILLDIRGNVIAELPLTGQKSSGGKN